MGIVAPVPSKPFPAAAAVRLLLAINGRFLAQRLTGVQRYAGELVRALDATLATERPDWAATLLLPPDAAEPHGLRYLRVRRVGRRRGHAWEQLDLPAAARGALLLSLGNTGPVLHGRQVLAIHDAGVFALPENYSTAFRTGYRLLWAGLAPRLVRVVTVSAFSAGELGRHLRLPPDRFAIVPNAADHMAAVAPDPTALDRFGLEPGSYVLAIGSRARAKNLETLARAMALLPEPRPLLATAGHQDPRIFAATGLSDGPGLRALGPVDDPTLKALYRGALCLAFPSRYEGFGLPPLEAMVAGCPVVAANGSSLPEVCGDAALYVDPDDPAAIAAAIARLAATPDLRRLLVERGRRRAGAFGWRSSARVLLDVLDGAAA